MQNLQENTWTDEEVKRFWDYQSAIPENYFTYQIGDRLVDFFGEYINDDISILDYGAGAGFFSEQVLIKTNAKITSCDFSPESVEKEIERCSKYHNYQGGYTVDELIKQNKKFDLIFCFEVIEHYNDNYLNLTFENFKNLLSENGKIIVSTPNNENLRRNYIACPCCGKVFHRWQHERSWTKESLSEYAKNQGLDVISVNPTNFTITKSKKTILTKFGLAKRKDIIEKNNPNGYNLIGIFRN